MAQDKNIQKSDQTNANQPNIWSFSIIVGALVAVLIVIIVAIFVFKQATDVTSVLGVILPSVSTIAAAAFGLSVGTNAGTQAGVQAGNATATATKEQTARVQHEVAQQVQALKRAVQPVHTEIHKLPVENEMITLNANNFQSINGTFELHRDTIPTIQARIAAIESALNALPT